MSNISVVNIKINPGRRNDIQDVVIKDRQSDKKLTNDNTLNLSSNTHSNLQYQSNWDHLGKQIASDKMFSKIRGKMKHGPATKNHSKPFQQFDEYVASLVNNEQPVANSDPKKKSSQMKITDTSRVSDMQSDKENHEACIFDNNGSPNSAGKPKHCANLAKDPQCQRCSKPVYFAERIEPNRGQILHQNCFKCKECGIKLTLHTFFNNQNDLDDLEVYCKSHAPRHTAVFFDSTTNMNSKYAKRELQNSDVAPSKAKPALSIREESTEMHNVKGEKVVRYATSWLRCEKEDSSHHDLYSRGHLRAKFKIPYSYGHLVLISGQCDTGIRPFYSKKTLHSDTKPLLKREKEWKPSYLPMNIVKSDVIGLRYF
ncbi:Hillarin [Nymphon striatum]|nr:Hillarin [Nymphon striatum]